MENSEITIYEGTGPGKKNSLKIYVYFKNNWNLLKELGRMEGVKVGRVVSSRQVP